MHTTDKTVSTLDSTYHKIQSTNWCHILVCSLLRINHKLQPHNVSTYNVTTDHRWSIWLLVHSATIHSCSSSRADLWSVLLVVLSIQLVLAVGSIWINGFCISLTCYLEWLKSAYKSVHPVTAHGNVDCSDESIMSHNDILKLLRVSTGSVCHYGLRQFHPSWLSLSYFLW